MSEKEEQKQLVNTDRYSPEQHVLNQAATNYLDEYLTYKGDEKPAWQDVENGVTQLLKKVLIGQEISKSWSIHSKSGVPTAIVHEDFSIKTSQKFLPAFLQACDESIPAYKLLAKMFEEQALANSHGLSKVLLPVVCFDVNSGNLDEDFEIESFTSRLYTSLVQIPYWKASSHMIYSDQIDPEHDFPSYAAKYAEVYNMSLDKFLTIQKSHEDNHVLLDAIIGKMFNQYATWFQEGGCEFLTGFDGRARGIVREFKSNGLMMSVQDVLESDNFQHKYGGGWILTKSIAETFLPNDKARGFLSFVKKLQLKKQDGRDMTISEATIDILDDEQIKDEVFKRFDEEYSKI